MSSFISSSERRRHVALATAWVLSAVGVVFLAGVALRKATMTFDYSEPKLVESLAFRERTFDVGFFGNSLTLEGVNPPVVDSVAGTSSYNFAVGGSSVLGSEMQLRHYLESNRPPRLVAFGAFLNTHTAYTGLTPTIDLALSPELRRLYDEKALALEGRKRDVREDLMNRVDAYRFRATVDLLLKWTVTRADTRPHFVAGQAQVAFSRTVDLGPTQDSKFPIEELRSWLNFCRERGIKTLVFEPPNSPGFSKRTPNRAEVLREVVNLVSEYPGARFISYEGLSDQLAADDWVNLNHLDVRGSQKFSAILARDVADMLR
jgi:hypothetical protein